MTIFHAKVQGLWVGMALGELYTRNHLAPLPTKSVQNRLPKTYGLSLLATRQLKQLMPVQEAFGLRCPRWQDMLLNLLPISFLHPAGTQGLALTLRTWLSEPHQRERLLSGLVLVQTLEWLQQGRELTGLIPSLLTLSDLQQTQTQSILEAVHQHLCQGTSLESIQREFQPDPSEQWLPGLAIGCVLYAVLSTPQDFRLTVQRATLLLPGQPELIMVTAALSGFLTEFSALPLDWRWSLKTLEWDIATPFETGLRTLADLCAGQWAGASTGLAPGVFHAPGQLRPR